MTIFHRMSRRAAPLLVLLFFAPISSAVAKPPSLDGVFPPGARRGETAQVTAAGRFEHWPVRGWASSRGIEVRAGKEKGRLSIAVAADAPIGLHWLRLYDVEGATAPRPFFVGTLPEILEAEPNDEPKAAQRLGSTAVTVNGRLAKSGDVDGFALELKQGQTLVASFEANQRLGSPMDGVLQVASSEGFVLAQNDDDHGRDPQIVFEAPTSGTFIVRVFAFPATPDSAIRFAGGAGFVYRLTLTTGGFIDHAYPLAVARSGPRQVEVVGWNIPESARRPTVVFDDFADSARIADPLLGNTSEVRAAPNSETVEAEPNSPARPQEVTLPLVLTGRIDSPRDVDAFRFRAKKGESLSVRIEARALGSPLDPVLKLAGPDGKVLSEVDDSGGARDAELRATAPADGFYTVIVRDLNGQGGLRHVYLLTASAPRPDFALAIKADQLTLKLGQTLDVPITITRRESFAEAIEVGLEEPPDGISAAPVLSDPKGNSARSVTLKLTASECACPGPIRILGKASGGRRRVASVPIPGSSATIDTVWLTIARRAAKPKP